MPRSLTSIAEDALTAAKALDGYLITNGLTFPSTEEDTLSDLPLELKETRNALVNSGQLLKQLALGAHGRLSEGMFAIADEISLGAIYKYRLAHHVPLDGSSTFADISRKCCLSEDLVERVLRQAMTNLVFTEAPTGHVKHSATSRLLATDPDLHDAIGLTAFDMAPLRGKTLEAISIHPDSQEPSETAFSLQNEEGVSMFSYLSKHPAHEKRFGNAMRYYSRVEEWDLKHLVRTYPWESLDRPGSIFVDIGGGQGTVSHRIASTTTHIQFIVQDLAGVVREGSATLPTELKNRLKFMEHDFFTEQPVKNADIYFFRWILHDWSDKYCLQILRQLIPAMKEGGKVMVYEAVLADGPETRWTEKQSRNLDLVMLAQFNARERKAKSWQRLFSEADARFNLSGIQRPIGSSLSIIEATWTMAQ